MSEIKSMSTREKIGTTTRRLIKYLYENRNQIFKLDKIYDDVQSFIPDQKKLIDLVFILDGIGILTRVSKKKFIFSGLKGMCSRINEYIKRKLLKTASTKDLYLFCDEIIVNGKKQSIKSSITQGLLFQDVFCNLALQSNKLMQRSQFDQIMENYREIQSKSLTNDLNNILMTLCLGERNETSETIQYTGPDLLNFKKITFDNLKNVNPNHLKAVVLDPHKKDNIYFSYLIKEADEKRLKKTNTQHQGLLKELTLDQAEIDKINKIINQSIQNNGTYYPQPIPSQLLPTSNINNNNSNNTNNNNNNLTQSFVKQDSVSSKQQDLINEQSNIKNEEQQNDKNVNNNEQKVIQDGFSEGGENKEEDLDKNTVQNDGDVIDVSEVPKAHISYFPKIAFALLKGRTWQFYVQKLQIIIGRSLINFAQKKATLNWHIDLEVGASKKVSRQHAVILFNFEKKRFEIKCLSQRYHIKVDNNLYSNKDDPVPLKNKSLITVGNEHFYFFLPKNMMDEALKQPDQAQTDQNTEQQHNRRQEDEEYLKNRGEEDMDEDELGDEDQERIYRKRRNMGEQVDDDEELEEEGQEEEEEGSISDLENKSTNRKKIKRNQDGYGQEDYDQYGQNSEELDQEEEEEEDGNNDFLDDDEKEFLKKTRQNVNENEEEEDDEDDDIDNENEEEDEDDEDQGNEDEMEGEDEEEEEDIGLGEDDEEEEIDDE